MAAIDMPPDDTGIAMRCTGCGAEHMLRLDGIGRDQAAMLAHLWAGSPMIYASPPGADSPIGKSECCAKPLAFALVGYPEPAAGEPPPPMLREHLPSTWAPPA